MVATRGSMAPMVVTRRLNSEQTSRLQQNGAQCTPSPRLRHRLDTRQPLFHATMTSLYGTGPCQRLSTLQCSLRRYRTASSSVGDDDDDGATLTFSVPAPSALVCLYARRPFTTTTTGAGELARAAKLQLVLLT